MVFLGRLTWAWGGGFYDYSNITTQNNFHYFYLIRKMDFFSTFLFSLSAKKKIKNQKKIAKVSKKNSKCFHPAKFLKPSQPFSKSTLWLKQSHQKLFRQITPRWFCYLMEIEFSLFSHLFWFFFFRSRLQPLKLSDDCRRAYAFCCIFLREQTSKSNVSTAEIFKNNK